MNQRLPRQGTRQLARAEYLAPAQLRDRLQGVVTLKTLANWRCQGKGPPFRKFGHRILYPVAEVVAWEATQQFTATSEYPKRRGR